jgi:hypothetical protein
LFTLFESTRVANCEDGEKPMKENRYRRRPHGPVL